MIADVDLAKAACIDIYDGSSAWDHHFFVSGIVFALRRVNDDDMIVFRGSKTPHDWYDDVEAIPVSVEGLGIVHAGFYQGLPDALAAVLPLLRKSVYVTGHSLGAARAYLFAQMLARAGVVPRAVVAFAPPRPGFADFRDKLVLSGAVVRGYHNHYDPIPDVPVFPFCEPVEPIAIAVAPPADDDDPVFKYHHGPLYYAGVAALQSKEPNA